MSLSTDNGILTTNQKIPPWKRLGLKLKYAKDLESQPPEVNKDHPTRRDESHASDEQSRPRKKRKTKDGDGSLVNGAALRRSSQSTPARPTELGRIGTDRDHPIPAHVEIDSKSSRRPTSVDKSSKQELETKSTPAARRKSVTFTAETKQEDGFSAETLIQQWSAEQQLAEQEARSAQQSLDSGPSSRKRKSSNQRDSNSVNFRGPDLAKTNGESVSRTTKEAPEYVQYLRFFYTDRESWKFNKNKQKHLLKHVLDIDRVPPRDTQAVLEYLQGLHGSGPRQRLIESATAVLQDIAAKVEGFDATNEMESEEARRTAYSDALRRQIERTETVGQGSSECNDQQLEDMRRENEKGKRAEAVLGELLQNDLYPNRTPSMASGTSQEPSGNSRLNGKSTDSAERKKKRKSRTQGARDEPSSSSEDEGDGGRVESTTTNGGSSSAGDTRSNGSSEKSVFEMAKGKKKIFDDDLLDKFFKNKNR